MGIYGPWREAIITVATDDDLTPEVELGRSFERLQIVIPPLTECKISLQVGVGTGGLFQTLGLDTTTGMTTGSFTTVFELGGWQYIKVATSVGQAADRTFKVRGFEP